ncbi:MAG: hypothetical protein ACK4VI_02725 [Alphaproteobacteria bacterium]
MQSLICRNATLFNRAFWLTAFVCGAFLLFTPLAQAETEAATEAETETEQSTEDITALEIEESDDAESKETSEAKETEEALESEVEAEAEAEAEVETVTETETETETEAEEIQPEEKIEKKAEAKPIKKRPAVLKVNYNQLEALGLYTTPAEGSLGRDLWSNTRRSFLMEFLPLLPDPTSSAAHRHMLMGLLLSEATPSLVENDVRVEAGKDIFTMRLERLNEMGAYHYSYKLFSKVNDEPYHENLAKAGIIAMLFNNERSVACLEYKTMADRDFSNPFWDDMAIYCDYVLGDEQGKIAAREAMQQSELQILQDIAADDNFKINYSTARFEDISELERALLIAGRRVIWPAITRDSLSALPLNHLGIFISRNDLSKDERFLVLTEAARRGLVDSSILGSFYTQVFDEELRQIESPGNIGWKQLPFSYQRAKFAQTDAEKWSFINKALESTDRFGIHSFTPFANIMQTIDIQDQRQATALKSLQIISAAGINYPGRWARFYSQLSAETKLEKKLAFIAELMTATNIDENFLESQKIVDFLGALDEDTRIKYSSIIENVDKNYKTIHNADEIYGKDLDLTLSGRYVMPIPRVWNQLVNSSQNKRIGEAVLLTSVVLRDAPLGKQYPGVVSDVLHSLNTVGLTNLSRNLSLETILEDK